MVPSRQRPCSREIPGRDAYRGLKTKIEIQWETSGVWAEGTKAMQQFPC